MGYSFIHYKLKCSFKKRHQICPFEKNEVQEFYLILLVIKWSV